jgi:hypothetical protein
LDFHASIFDNGATGIKLRVWVTERQTAVNAEPEIHARVDPTITASGISPAADHAANHPISSRITLPALSLTGRPVAGATFSLAGFNPSAASTVA